MTREYHYIFRLVGYPEERKFRMEAEPLPDWMYLTITEKDDSKFLTVHSRIHVNKEVLMQPSYSKEFSDNSIIEDLSPKIYEWFIK